MCRKSNLVSAATFSLFTMWAAVGLAEPIGFVERYALADNRQALLAELIPGNVDYYYYHVLHYQVTGQLDLAESMINRWQNDRAARGSELLTAARDRQRVLTFDATPDRTIEYLRDRLNVDLNHTPPPERGERRYPSRFDTARLDPDRLIDEALRSDKQLTRSGLQRLASRFLRDRPVQLGVDLRWLLEQVDGPWMDELDQLVIEELKQRRPTDRRFGDLAAHRQLTLEELRNVAGRVDDVRYDDAMVREMLLRLRPDDDVDLSSQIDVRADYLARVDQYVTSLPANYNSLKAAILFRRLDVQRQQGRYDVSLFLRYLRLPRQSSIWRPVPLPSTQGVRADLNQDFMELALVPAVNDEQPLVRDYLQHFLRDADSTQQFDELLRPDYVRRVFAETKLLAGVGDSQQWYRMLSPQEQQQLKERVELTLAATNPRHFDPAGTSSIDVDVKNVDELVVRIYEINTLAYYRTHHRRIDTDVDLDGLAPTFERRLSYSFPDVRLHREQIDLPEIEGRGEWIVDLLGGGLRARALIRRGELDYVIRPRGGGLQVSAVDEDGRIVKQTKLIVGGQEFVANEEGLILLPPVDKAIRRNAVLQDAQLAIPIQFEHPAESYVLQAQMYVDRQQLLPGRMADVLLRTRLTGAGAAIDPTDLKNVTATVVATDRDGIETAKKYEDLKLRSDGETVVSFRVPNRLGQLRVTLNADVVRTSDGRTETLSGSDSWQLNGTLANTVVHDGYLTRDGKDWVIEVRGENGEPIAGASVAVQVEPAVRRQPVPQTLQADDQGQVQLGELPGAVGLGWTVAGQHRHRDLTLDTAVWPSRLHATADEALAVPLLHGEDRESDDYVLIELREDRPFADRTDQLERSDGQLNFQLAAGNYRLHHTPSGRAISIAIAKGMEHAGVAMSAARHLEVAQRDSLGIASIDVQADAVIVRTAGSNEFTRIHVVASRYVPRERLADQLGLSHLPLGVRRVHDFPSGYVSDLALGEEYQYVLRRQYAKKYPGVMLPQPSLLLNPWETEETENQSQTAADGVAPPASAPAEEARTERLAERGAAAAQRDDVTPTYDFLPLGSIFLSNLVPDEEGNVRIPNDLLGESTIIQAVACNPTTLVERTVFRPLATLQPTDLRLASTLPADRALALRRGVLIAGPDQPLDPSRLAGSQYQTYSSVAELLELYTTLVGEDELGKFHRLGAWHTLDAAEKRELYGRFASHELHLFLYQYDRPFFDSVVRPYLENKKEKQFVDAWLLEHDLAPWTEPWRLAGLNAAERALLARRNEAVREAILRRFGEQIEIADASSDRLRQLVESGLGGRRLGRAARSLNQLQAESEVDFDAGAVELEANANGVDAFAWEGLPAQQRAEMSDLMQRLQSKSRALSLGDARFGMPSRESLFFEQIVGGKAFYQHLDVTKEWAESNWLRVRTANANADLIPGSAFWLDVAREEPISSHLLLPTQNRHAALAALAFSGLPLEANAESVVIKDDAPFAPEQPLAIVTKRLIPLEDSESESTLLIGQRFEAADKQASESEEVRIAPEEYLTGVAYRSQVIISNPTPRQRTVDVLWQIPEGSLPVGGNQATDSRQLSIEPFAVSRLSFAFYFPQAGSYTHYPVTVSDGDQVVARGEEHAFEVVDQPTTRDERSWAEVARRGSGEEIGDFLREANLQKLDLSLVAHRMRDREVYDSVLAVLDSNRVYRDELYGYALHHQDQPRLTNFLSMQSEFVRSVGPVFRSPLLNVDPVERNFYEHLEYAPLIRGRIHALREQPEILNDKFLQHYRELMNVLAHQRTIEPEQRLALAYYLLIQNRITEAIEYFGSVGREETSLQLQYDYFAGYLALHRGDIEAAEQIAAEYREHPVPRWNERFANLRRQLQQQIELSGQERLVAAADRELPSETADLEVIDRELRQAASASEQPSITVAVEGDRLRLSHRNATEATIRFYGVDLELLFSKNPFVREDLQRMAMVRPLESKQIDFGDPSGVATFALPEALSRQTLLVEVAAGAARSTALYYGGRLTTYVSEGFGQLQVTDAQNGKPVSGAYVKVYAKHANGQTLFYKDGYTDLRGRFDYASLSAPGLGTTTQFAILVLDPERGATLHQVKPPTR